MNRDPTPGEVKPRPRALVGEPSILEATRGVLHPVVPLSEVDERPAESVPVPVEEPEAPVQSQDQLAGLLAKAATQLAEFEKQEEDAEAADDDAEPTEEENAYLDVTDELAEREHLGVAVDEATLIFERARACFEDLAALGNMRRPLPDAPWLSPRTEERLLTKVDAIVACGEDVLPGLVKLLEERPVPDPELTWATLFLFGSLSGDDALDQVMRIAGWAPLEVPEMMEMVADALGLAPHVGLEREMRAWLQEADPARRAVAVRVLTRKGSLTTPEAVAAASREDSREVLTAANALATSRGDVSAGSLQRLLSHPDPTVVRASLASALLRRSPLGLRRATELTQAGRAAFADAALFVGIAAGPEALEILREQSGASAEAVEALGWLGHLGAIEPLLELLEAGSESVKAAALMALQRITAASLTEADPDPDYSESKAPLGSAFSPPPRPAELASDLAVWSAWWKKHGNRADPRIRYRFGHPWSPQDNFWELMDGLSRNRERELCYCEIVWRTGCSSSLDLEGFAVRQRREIDALRQLVETRRAGIKPGSWPTPFAR